MTTYIKNEHAFEYGWHAAISGLGLDANIFSDGSYGHMAADLWTDGYLMASGLLDSSESFRGIHGATKDEDMAYYTGYVAYTMGADSSDNPYSEDEADGRLSSNARLSWFNGFWNCKDEQDEMLAHIH